MILDRVRMRQDAAGPRAVLEELAAVLLRGDAQPNGRLLQRDGAVAHDAVKAETGDVQHILRIQLLHAAFAGRIGVGQLALRIPIHRHVVGQ